MPNIKRFFLMISSKTQKNLSFIAATLSMLMLCLASTAAIPFFATYQSLYNISNSILSLSTVLYFLGNVLSLIFLSRISNYLGRKPTLLLILFIGILGCGSFIFVNNGILLLIGRLLQGFSCGMAAGSILTYILETAPSNNVGIITTSNISQIGFSIGALISGAIVDINPYMRNTVFSMIILMFVFSMILIIFSKETIKHKKGVLRSIKPEVKITEDIKRFIPLSIILLISIYSITGFYQSFSSSISLLEFHNSSKFLAAIIYASIVGPQIIGSTFISRFTIKESQRYGILGFTLSMILVNVALFNKWLILFILFNIIASLFFGLTFTATMDNLIQRTSHLDMPGVLSTAYIITDGGTALVNLIISVVISYTSLINVSLLYLLFIIISCILTFKITNKLKY